MPGPSPYPTGGDTAAGVMVIILFYLAVTVVVLAIAYVLTGVTLMMFFRKVGVNPAIAWVPIYNHWKWLEVGGQNGAFALLSLIPYGGIVTTVFLAIGMHRSGIAFRKDSAWVVLGIFVPWLWCILLSGRDEVYDPSLITAAGYPPPRAGYGAVVPA
ncbi:MAG TPA: DUF5684 domain-containing protein [Pseudolysinimonas sp.]|nr:DUF5684 domain-containing protein [Pseudolysinimonas sp.]